MYSDEQIFVWDVESLQAISANPTQRNLLDSSAILRRLLMDDGGPLVHKVARKFGVKVKYRVLNRSIEDLSDMDGVGGATPVHFFQNPMPFESGNAIEVDLGKMLSTPMHRVCGSVLTVRDLIRYCSDVGGGVHQGKPKDRGNAKIIHETANDIWFGGSPYPLMELQAVIKIVLAALMPMYERLRA